MNEIGEFASPAPIGEIWKPVGAVRKKIYALADAKTAVNSELP